MRRIEEHEFTHFAQGMLLDLSEGIRETGLPLLQIAKACRLSWKTVRDAAEARPVRMESATRIIYFIREHNKMIYNNGKD